MVGGEGGLDVEVPGPIGGEAVGGGSEGESSPSSPRGSFDERASLLSAKVQGPRQGAQTPALLERVASRVSEAGHLLDAELQDYQQNGGGTGGGEKAQLLEELARRRDRSRGVPSSARGPFRSPVIRPSPAFLLESSPDGSPEGSPAGEMAPAEGRATPLADAVAARVGGARASASSPRQGAAATAAGAAAAGGEGSEMGNVPGEMVARRRAGGTGVDLLGSRGGRMTPPMGSNRSKSARTVKDLDAGVPYLPPKTGLVFPVIYPSPTYPAWRQAGVESMLVQADDIAAQMQAHDAKRLGVNRLRLINRVVYDCNGRSRNGGIRLASTMDSRMGQKSRPGSRQPFSTNTAKAGAKGGLFGPGRGAVSDVRRDKVLPYYVPGKDAYPDACKASKDTTIVFESRFESGNLGRAIQVYPEEYDLVLRPDVNTNRHTQWYLFQMTNLRRGLRYKFNIINLCKPNSLYNGGMQPCLYSCKEAALTGKGWHRSGFDIAYYQNPIKKSTRGPGASTQYFTLTFTLEFEHDADTVYLAYSYPYKYSNMRRYLKALVDDRFGRALTLRCEPLCETLAGNVCDLLTITNFQCSPEKMKEKKGCVISARVHAGESNASWMMKGFLDFLTGSSTEARELRDRFVFKIIPMLNPDGVIIGNYRCHLGGQDLNRMWGEPSEKLHPTIYHAKEMIRRFTEEREVLMFLDLHGHSRKKNIFIYGCENDRVTQPELYNREQVIPKMLDQASSSFSFKSCNFRVSKGKDGTARIVNRREFGIVNSYTMEASFFGAGRIQFNTAHYEEMGHSFCRTLHDLWVARPYMEAQILAELERESELAGGDSDDQGSDGGEPSEDRPDLGVEKPATSGLDHVFATSREEILASARARSGRASATSSSTSGSALGSARAPLAHSLRREAPVTDENEDHNLEGSDEKGSVAGIIDEGELTSLLYNTAAMMLDADAGEDLGSFADDEEGAAAPGRGPSTLAGTQRAGNRGAVANAVSKRLGQLGRSIPASTWEASLAISTKRMVLDGSLGSGQLLGRKSSGVESRTTADTRGGGRIAGREDGATSPVDLSAAFSSSQQLHADRIQRLRGRIAGVHDKANPRGKRPGASEGSALSKGLPPPGVYFIPANKARAPSPPVPLGGGIRVGGSHLAVPQVHHPAGAGAAAAATTSSAGGAADTGAPIRVSPLSDGASAAAAAHLYHLDTPGGGRVPMVAPKGLFGSTVRATR